MPRQTAAARKLQDRQPDRSEFDLRELFPRPIVEGTEIGPMEKQQRVFTLISSGEVAGGGIVCCGGKGSAKTVTGCCVDGWAHQRYPGLRSAVCRETYPAFLTSTWDEYSKMLERMPARFINGYSKPSGNAMGWVEWAIGGLTMFLSLSNNETWESANLGLAWVDEGQQQVPVTVDKMTERLRQVEGPRCMLITKNAKGKDYAWRWAHPESKDHRWRWHYIESSTLDNPNLPPDYIEGLERKYKPGTLMHSRWVLGEAVALEGSVFQEVFDPSPTRMVHVVPDHPIPAGMRCGRGLDSGIDNPCVVVWGALDGEDNIWCYRTYTKSGKSAMYHAGRINELEKDEYIIWTPADPEIFREIHEVEGSTSKFFSTASKYREAGCRVTRADNRRKPGLDLLFELLTVDERRIHPCTLRHGSPRLFILNNESNAPLIECLETVKWVEEASTGTRDSPDDVAKVNDHWFDAVRYLVMAMVGRNAIAKEPVRFKPAEIRGSRGYQGY